VVERWVDPDTGHVMVDGCRPGGGVAYRELFLRGDQPDEECPDRGDARVAERRGWEGDADRILPEAWPDEIGGRSEAAPPPEFEEAERPRRGGEKAKEERKSWGKRRERDEDRGGKRSRPSVPPRVGVRENSWRSDAGRSDGMTGPPRVFIIEQHPLAKQSKLAAGTCGRRPACMDVPSVREKRSKNALQRRRPCSTSS
jgi:hypothetical protein